MVVSSKVSVCYDLQCLCLPGTLHASFYRCVKHFFFLSFSYLSLSLCRQAWALVSVVGGGNASCSESVREHENHDTGGRAVARRDFTTVDGDAFSVTAYSEWKTGENWLMMQFIFLHII